MNFVEGTRFSTKKHQQQQSPYTHLLQPKAGGVAFVLAAMGDQLTAILDVSIDYSPKAVGFWDFLCGRIEKIRISVRHLPVTDEIIGDYYNDSQFKERFHSWLNTLWREKDHVLSNLRKTHPN